MWHILAWQRGRCLRSADWPGTVKWAGTLFLTLLFLFIANPAGKAAGNPVIAAPDFHGGGPDQFGYTFKDSAEPGGPAYAWEEISATGTSISNWTSYDDGYAGPIPIGFSFDFYGTRYDELYVGTNGFLSFGRGSGAIVGGTLPSSDGPNNDIGLFGGDMYLNDYGQDSQVYFQTLSNPTRFVVEYVNLYYCCSQNTAHTLEAILYPDGDIQVQYKTLNASSSSYVGIENASGSDGLGYGSNLADSLAIRYDYPTGVFLNPLEQIGYGQPGQVVTYALELTNRTGATDTFDLSLEAGNAWPVSLSITQPVTVDDQESVLFFAYASIPSNATAGSSDQATVRAQSATSPATLYDRAVLETTATSGETAYVVLAEMNQVALLDVGLHTLLQTMDLGTVACQYPWSIAMSPDGGRVYVNCVYSDQIAVIDTGGNTVIDVIQEVPGGEGIAFTRDGSFALVTNQDGYQITVIDTETFAKTAISTPTYTRSIAAHPYLDRAYVTSDDGTVLVIDTASMNIMTSIPVFDAVYGVTISPDGRLIYAASRYGSGLAVIDAYTNVVKMVAPNPGYLMGLQISGDGSTLYAAANGSGLQVIDAESLQVVTTLPVGTSAWHLALTCDGRELWVSGEYQLPVIDTATNSVGDTIDLPGGPARGIVLCPQRVQRGLLLLPVTQTNAGAPGSTASHGLVVVNATGHTDQFTLSVGQSLWPTALSTSIVGPLADGATAGLHAETSVPVDAPWYATDQVTVTVTGVITPADTNHAVLTSKAFAPPSISAAPRSLISNLDFNQTASQVLTISNGNGVTLTYQLADIAEPSSLPASLGIQGANVDLGEAKPSSLDRKRDGLDTSVRTSFPRIRSDIKILDGSPVLIIQDEYPWGFDSIQQVLSSSNIAFDQVGSSAMSTIDLNQYSLIVVPSVQNSSFYSIWNANLQRFEAYVRRGGKLWLSATTYSDTAVLPLAPGGVANQIDLQDHNVTVAAGHPWIVGVPNPIYGSYASHNSFHDLPPQSIVVAQASSSGRATLVDYRLGYGRVMLTGQTLEHAWVYDGDAKPILSNSLLDMFNATLAGDALWLSEQPISGTISSQTSAPILVTFDAAGLQPGEYYASIWISSNDPVQPLLQVPVTMTVEPTLDLGRITGSISDGWTGQPLTATVELMGVGSTTAQHTYELWAPAGSYSLTVTSAGYMTATLPVTITSGGVTLQNVSLEPARPRLMWAPEQISAHTRPGGSAELTLVLTNAGPLPLDVEMFEVDLRAAQRALSPADLAGKRILYDRAHNEPNTNEYQTLVADAIAAGAEVDENWFFPIEEEVLEDYDILWVNCCGSLHWGFSEMTAVNNWLRQGGAILVQGQNSASSAGPASIFGIYYVEATCVSGSTSDIRPHPISSGVSSLNLPYTCWRLSPSPGSDIVAFDMAGQPHVVAKQFNGGKMVVVGSDDFHEYYIDYEDNRLLANNILAWLARPAYSDVPWMSASATGGTIPPHSSWPITLEFDASGLNMGTYQAQLAIEHNDPAQPFPVEVPVTLTVLPAQSQPLYLPLVLQQ